MNEPQEKKPTRHLIEALIISLVIFLFIFFSVLSSGTLHNVFFNLDNAFAAFLGPFANVHLARFFLFFTYLGNVQIILTIECGVVLLFLVRGERRDSVLFVS